MGMAGAEKMAPVAPMPAPEPSARAGVGAGAGAGMAEAGAMGTTGAGAGAGAGAGDASKDLWTGGVGTWRDGATGGAEADREAGTGTRWSGRVASLATRAPLPGGIIRPRSSYNGIKFKAGRAIAASMPGQKPETQKAREALRGLDPPPPGLFANGNSLRFRRRVRLENAMTLQFLSKGLAKKRFPLPTSPSSLHL